jgi:peptide deformylase
MSQLRLVDEDDPILSLVAPIFDFSKPPTDPSALVADMFEMMFSNRGVGLAAPQVGLLYRMFVMDTDGQPRACFNPTVVSISTKKDRDLEGCLSFPDLWLKIARPVSIEAQFTNSSGNLVNEKFENLAARCYLHETDHLNGVRFVDLVGPLSLKTAKARRAKNI